MNERDAEWIDLYLLGRLDDKARAEVELRAATDPAFAAELALQKDIVGALERSGETALRDQIAALDKRLEKEGFFHRKKETRLLLFRNPYALLAAASVALALVAAVWLYFNRSMPAPQDNVAEQPLPPPTITPDTLKETPKNLPAHQANPFARASALASAAYTPPHFSRLHKTDGDNTSPAARAVLAFEQKRYREAIVIAEEVTAGAPEYLQVREIAAHAYFGEKRYDKAAAICREMAALDQPPYSERAQWYLLLALAYQLPRTEKEFKAAGGVILADTGHPYFKEAEQLTAALK